VTKPKPITDRRAQYKANVAALAARGGNVPDDSEERIRLTSGATTWMLVTTYKESITMHTPGEIVWMSADAAEKVGKALIAAARHRRKIDAAIKRQAKATKP
jgi:hypothetical protein